jgi:hypothetical protein
MRTEFSINNCDNKVKSLQAYQLPNNSYQHFNVADKNINMSRILRIACIQLKVTNDKESNVQRSLEKIKEAKQCGADLICLPGE